MKIVTLFIGIIFCFSAQAKIFEAPEFINKPDRWLFLSLKDLREVLEKNEKGETYPHYDANGHRVYRLWPGCDVMAFQVLQNKLPDGYRDVIRYTCPGRRFNGLITVTRKGPNIKQLTPAQLRVLDFPKLEENTYFEFYVNWNRIRFQYFNPGHLQRVYVTKQSDFTTTSLEMQIRPARNQTEYWHKFTWDSQEFSAVSRDYRVIARPSQMPGLNDYIYILGRNDEQVSQAHFIDFYNRFYVEEHKKHHRVDP